MSDTIGPITAVRALRQIQLDKSYMAGKSPRSWTAEQLDRRDGASLEALNQAVDVRNAEDKAWFLRWENLELFALRRDRRYASRSRRWIYTRAYQNKLLFQQEIWQQFVRWHSELENTDGYLSELVAANPLSLMEKSFEELLKLPTQRAST